MLLHVFTDDVMKCDQHIQLPLSGPCQARKEETALQREQMVEIVVFNQAFIIVLGKLAKAKAEGHV